MFGPVAADRRQHPQGGAGQPEQRQQQEARDPDRAAQGVRQDQGRPDRGQADGGDIDPAEQPVRAASDAARKAELERAGQQGDRGRAGVQQGGRQPPSFRITRAEEAVVGLRAEEVDHRRRRGQQKQADRQRAGAPGQGAAKKAPHQKL